MTIRPIALAWCSFALIAVSPAAAQELITLTEDSGRSAYIGFPHTGRVGTDVLLTNGGKPTDELSPRAITPPEIAELFAKLCLSAPFSRETYDQARTGIAKDFVTKTIRLASSTAPNPLFGSKTQLEVEFNQEAAPYGLASLWLGENAQALAGRQYRIFSGGVMIIGPVKTASFYAPQCNLTLQVSGLTSTKALFDGLQSSGSNLTAIKRTEKPKYGYAVWTLPSANGRVARLTANADALDKSTQTLHITIQLLPVGKVK